MTNAFLWTEGEARELRFDFFEAFALFGPLLSSTHQTFVTMSRMINDVFENMLSAIIPK